MGEIKQKPAVQQVLLFLNFVKDLNFDKVWVNHTNVIPSVRVLDAVGCIENVSVFVGKAKQSFQIV